MGVWGIHKLAAFLNNYIKFDLLLQNLPQTLLLGLRTQLFMLSPAAGTKGKRFKIFIEHAENEACQPSFQSSQGNNIYTYT